MKRLIMYNMSRHAAFTACMVTMAMFVSARASHAQVKQPTGYVLYRIMTTFQGPKQPQVIEATPEGGRVNVDIKFHKTKCTEAMRFTWKYDRDIRFLRPGESFNVTCTAGNAGGNCDKGRYGFMIAGGSEGSLFVGAKNLPATEAKEVGHKTVGTTGRLNNDTGIHGISPTGTKGTKIEVWKAAKAKRIFHKVWFQSGSAVPGESLAMEIAYVYEAVYSPDAPQVSDDDIVMDNPGEGVADGTTRPEGPGGATSPGGTGTTGGGSTGDGTNGTGSTTSGNGSGGTGTTPAGGGPGTGGGIGTGSGGAGGSNSGPSGRQLKADKRTVQAGERVLVPVYLINPQGVANVNFTVKYDPKIIVPDGNVIKGSLLGAARLEANSTLQGLIRIGFAQKTGLSPTGIVAYLPFKAVGKAGQKSALTLAVSEVNDANGKNLPIALIDGEVKIVGPGGGVPGDCDGDDELTVADAICALKMSVELMPVNKNLDINNDGKVTSGDAREIMQKIP